MTEEQRPVNKHGAGYAWDDGRKWLTDYKGNGYRMGTKYRRLEGNRTIVDGRGSIQLNG